MSTHTYTLLGTCQLAYRDAALVIQISHLMQGRPPYLNICVWTRPVTWQPSCMTHYSTVAMFTNGNAWCRPKHNILSYKVGCSIRHLIRLFFLFDLPEHLKGTVKQGIPWSQQLDVTSKMTTIYSICGAGVSTLRRKINLCCKWGWNLRPFDQCFNYKATSNPYGSLIIHISYIHCRAKFWLNFPFWSILTVDCSYSVAKVLSDKALTQFMDWVLLVCLNTSHNTCQWVHI